MPAQWTSIDVSNEQMEAYFSYPQADEPHPAVIVVQEIWGVNGYIQSIANRLTAAGYAAIAPSLFHREGPWTIGLFEERDTALQRLGRMRDDQILADLRASLGFLKAQTNVQADRIGIIGFCIGGRIAYLGAANLDGLACAVDFYGGRSFNAFGEGPSPFEQTANVKVPLLGLFGEDDQDPSAADVDKIAAELQRHGKTFEFHTYPGAGHAFLCEERPTYRRDAAVDAWGKTLAWFERHLKQ